MRPPTVSAVIPTYQRATLLERALRSVVPQCASGDEVIVVDDGSTDDTEQVARSFGPLVRYLRTPHLGAGAARNAGIRAATGDLVAFLDSDDEWMPGKLAAQRAVFAAFPELLFTFSDFGSIGEEGEPQYGCLSSWVSDCRPWDVVLGQPGVPSTAISGLDSEAPPFVLYRGQLFDTFLTNWCVFTSTVVVRRAAAGDALRFPDDVPTYEDFECFARLAQRGTAGFLSCETAWQHKHAGPRLTDADAATNADTAIRIIERIWGTDDAYLAAHRARYEAALDDHRRRKLRYLLGRGDAVGARRELALLHAPAPPALRLVVRLPESALHILAGARRELLARRACSSRGGGRPSGLRIGERRGRGGLVSLEDDWRRLYAASAQRTGYLAYEAQLAYVDHLMDEPDRLRCLVLEAGDEVRGICLLEPKTDRLLGAPVRAWGMTMPPHLPLPEFLCPDGADRRVFLPLLVEHLRLHREGPALVAPGSPVDDVVWRGLSSIDRHDWCVNPTSPLFVIACDRSFDDFLAGLSSRFRSSIRRRRRKFEALSGARFEVAASEPALTAAFETFLELEASGWKGSAGTRTAVACRNGQPAFFRDVVRGGQGDDGCEVNSIYAEGRCIASSLCMRSGSEYAGLKIGYDERYASLGPGHLLTAYILERCCADAGLSRVNLVGDESWLLRWKPLAVPLQTVYVAIAPVRGRMLVTLVRLRVGPVRRLARWIRTRRAMAAKSRGAASSREDRPVTAGVPKPVPSSRQDAAAVSAGSAGAAPPSVRGRT